MDFELWREPMMIVVIVLLLIIARAAYERNRMTGRPPMVSYAVPWVGSAIDLGKDPDMFFKRAIAKYGDVFTVKVLGRTITYVTSPQLITEVYKNPQKYDFGHIHKSMESGVFMMTDEFTNSRTMREILPPMNHKFLSPTHLQPIVDEHIVLTYQHLKERANEYNEMNVPLKDFVVPLVFEPSSYAIFGKHCPVDDLFKPLKLFDNKSHLMLGGIPKIFMKEPAAALDNMATIFEERYLLNPNAMDDASDIIKEYERIIREGGFDTRDVARILVTFLWALQANAPFAAYWLIALNLQRPDGLKPLAAEVDEAVASWNTANPSHPLDSHRNVIDFVNQANLPLLDSAIQETFRFTTSSMSMRGVMEPTELGGFTFKEGDVIVCSTRAVHLDPEVHERPDEYIPTRYMMQKKFMKNGRSVTNHTMPFGGGVSMCDGRHFARKELKTLLVLLLMKFTIEPDPKSAERPTIWGGRIGLGVMHPKGDMRVIVRKREEP